MTARQAARPRHTGRAVRALALLTLLPTSGITGAAAADAASGPCVRVGTTCFGSVQAAVDAAADGQTVRIPRGTFAGGILITKSLSLVGAGPSDTALVGGEHVVSVGVWGDPTPPTVTLRGLTLRGGRAGSSPQSVPFVGVDGVVAGGAGLAIPAGQDDGTGATVTVIDSVITGNVATPTATLLPGPGQEPFWPHCPDGFCLFAGAFGGGVQNWGDLTLIRSTVSRNTAAGSLSSDTEGGGIYSFGPLTLRASTVSDNQSVVVAPNGRFAEGGGIFMGLGTTLTVKDSAVVRNTAGLTSTIPVTNPDGTATEMLVNAGGITVMDGSTVAIASSRIDDNIATVDDPNGQPSVINAALQLGASDLTLTDSSVSGNRALARIHSVLPDFGPLGGALQWCRLGTLDGLRANGNVTRITAVHGDAAAAGAVFAGATSCQGADPGPSTLTRSQIRGNTTTAIALEGRADVLGAGIDVSSNLTMSQVVVADNRGSGQGLAGDVQGGGIWNGMWPVSYNDGLHSALTVQRSLVSGNRLTGATTLAVTGGGIFTGDPITLQDVVIKGNAPDQCTGCSLASPRAAAQPSVTATAGTGRSTTSSLAQRLIS
jgi:hypothetical protein